MKHEPLAVPALRGVMGDWIYYSCLIPLSEIATRVDYASVVHPDKAMSALIQRSLEGKRAQHISEYLATKEHFLNSLVLATYGGNPDWHEIGNYTSAGADDVLDLVPAESFDSLGFLRLGGTEKIFAIDGQHRLAGIRKALAEGVDLDGELVAVILVGHKNTSTGMQRTRRLFTTLNKTAVPVRKRDIISLDEDDVMAITARRLVETNAKFRHPKIAVISSQSIPTSNRECLTTISSLYDTLKLIFKHTSGNRSDRHLRFNRPSDSALEDYYEAATSFFDALAETFPPVGQLMSSDNPADVTTAQRRADGGHLLFRSIGLEIVTRAAIVMASEREVDLPDAVRLLRGIPTDIASEPFLNVIWSETRDSIDVKGKVLARDLLLHICSLPVTQQSLSLESRYARATGATQTEALRRLGQLKLS